MVDKWIQFQSGVAKALKALSPQWQVKVSKWPLEDTVRGAAMLTYAQKLPIPCFFFFFFVARDHC